MAPYKESSTAQLKYGMAQQSFRMQRHVAVVDSIFEGEDKCYLYRSCKLLAFMKLKKQKWYKESFEYEVISSQKIVKLQFQSDSAYRTFLDSQAILC